MSTIVTNFLMTVPTVSIYFGLGALGSGVVFNKLSHLAEYTLNKTFGDYKNPRKTLDNKIIISMPMYKDCYYTQNIVLAALVSFISSQVFRILISVGCPSIIAIPVLVGSLAAPILFSLFNMILRQSGGHHGRWVEINDEEINKHGINKSNVAKIDWSARVYCGFGTAPIYFPGENTDTDSFY